MERLRGSGEFEPALAIEDCLSNPEFAFELTSEQIERLIAIVLTKLIEIYDPHLKTKYKALLQTLRMAQTNNSSGISANRDFILSLHDSEVQIHVPIHRMHGLSAPILAGLEIDHAVLDPSSSFRELYLITDPHRRFWINLVISTLCKKSGEPEKVMYIADWYVAPPLRGHGVGSQLQQVAESVAVQEGCKLVCGRLVPESGEDLDRLLAAKRNRGFDISFAEGSAPLAVKRLLD